MNGITLFTGFDGAGLGMEAAGAEIVGGVEYDAAIAEVAKTNGRPVDVINILDADPRKWLGVDAIHASPVCTRASMANSSAEENEEGTKEAPLDIAMAEATMRFVDVIRPRIFTLENVWQYRNFQSFIGGKKTAGIVPALMKMGYRVKYWHVNAADYGVPQTRKRLILVARLDGEPVLPERSHTDPKDIQAGQGLLFVEVRPWIGWYKAIEDLIPTLPSSEFAPWQMERLPVELIGSILLAGAGNTNIADGEPGKGVRYENDPAHVVASDGGGRTPRAFLVDGQNADQTRKPSFRMENEPMITVTGSASKGYTRAWLSQGRVVKLTPRALARFQTFPDSYQLPEKAALACKGIGNAVPPRLIEHFYKVNV